MTAACVLSDTEHMTEMRQVTIRELARNTAEVLARVANGEEIEITRNGQPVAILRAPDPVDMKMRELIKAGVIPPDLVQRQGKLLSRLRASRTRLRPGQTPPSEIIIEERDKERF
jgi:antitoxin (DNA-binding transcriptional repressor) of toxin-antitoxin stability system